MIRRKVSAGLLRAVSTPTSTPKAGQQASLASAVLLNSQRNWKGETVTALKAELKRRGLSQVGNKTALIARLQSAEISSMLPPVPTLSGLTTRSVPSTPTKSRTLSTTSSRKAPPVPPLPRPTQPKSDEHVSSTGPAIESQRSEATKVEEIKPERVGAAPGLPATAAKGGSKGLDVYIPTAKEDEVAEQIIPLMPDNFRTSPPPPALSEADAMPKVSTAASTSTHPSAPVHAMQEITDIPPIKSAQKFDIPLADIFNNVISAPAQAWKATGLSLPEIGLPEGQGKGDKYEKAERPLDEEERKGLRYVGALIGSLAFVGFVSRKASTKSKKDNSGAVGYGDQTWSKASGAQVVGHGARKV
ncbi:hypothetical protein TREMEDRAFT_42405 [Tremella mesenterica DSM 1558]|uniref:uncharacterized protein n=1 Tax=Tremella mesenterica (strain ATCC 24925 / CBS 8224 / DSM 1558 / NBRC 9311 / NRRL Y-6157 / RJB 2259-6 / UBC 559-6) TaxID=578456 RepID=UPI0003F49502|nr:uncharacterized protein TREMEDRAFT_42405 [Tremella mesenterica DSM 1558]EIW73533.1 hypothetical protein TREMEDRAFT_42405 [Tremella mesenterica DSM 1558]